MVLCVDEKSQIQALDRTAPILPMQPHLIERRTPDYVRNGTSTLFAALEVATGKVTAACKPRHRNQEFLAFLKQVARAYPSQELHLIMDNYAAHKHANVRTWLDANPRIQIHFTPTHASWMNLVEVFFGIIERQAIRRGTFRSVKELNAKIRAFIDGWNTDRPIRSSGPKPPARSWQKPTVQQLRTQTTSPAITRTVNGPGQPANSAPASQTRGRAVSALSGTGFGLGIAAFFLFGFPVLGPLICIAAIVFSTIALLQRVPGASKKDMVFAIIGLALGAIYTLMALIWAVTGRM
ncbi:insertion element IS630 uncharacterized 39 kDa protein [Arthrobacter sp. Hiyo8]|nr:insertion element IS630 uncharacterized 39 kDa protein [Arthrobacter sp. Hiyo8]